MKCCSASNYVIDQYFPVVLFNVLYKVEIMVMDLYTTHIT